MMLRFGGLLVLVSVWGCGSVEPGPGDPICKLAKEPPGPADAKQADPAEPIGCTKPVLDVSLDAAAKKSGYSIKSQTAKAIPSTEAHFIAVYETRTDHTETYHPTGSATVHVDRPGRHVLVMTSYEPTHWTVTAAPGAIIEKVIVEGYHLQNATVPAGTTLERHSYEDRTHREDRVSTRCATGDDCIPESYFHTLATSYGMKFATYGGSYRATKFVIRSTEATCPTETKEEAPPNTPFQCSAFAQQKLVLLEMPAATVKEQIPMPLDTIPFDAAGQSNDDFFFCDGTVQKASRVTKTIEKSEILCSAVTGDESAIWVYKGPTVQPNLVRYANWDALLHYQSNKSLQAKGHFSRIGLTASRKELLASWHFADRLLRIDLETGAASEIYLEGFNGWIHGIDDLGDGRIVVSSEPLTGGILVFDEQTGKPLSHSVPENGSSPLYHGIVCHAQ